MKQVLLTLVVVVTAIATVHSQSATTPAPDPGISLYMYRKVPADKRDEFVKRETTYWSEVVRKATDPEHGRRMKPGLAADTDLVFGAASIEKAWANALKRRDLPTFALAPGPVSVRPAA